MHVQERTARFRTTICWLLLAGGLASTAPAAGPPPGALWNRDAPGFRIATQRADLSGKPLFVYFYTNWCGYCRQFERELLSAPEVARALEQFEAVGIDAELGMEEVELSNRYGVTSFPALYVHPKGPQGPVRMGRSTTTDGQSRLMTPKEFAELLDKAAALAAKGA